MFLLSKLEFTEKTGISPAIATLLFDRFCPEMIRDTEPKPDKYYTGRHYKYKLNKEKLQRMVYFAENLMVSRPHWYSVNASLKQLLEQCT